MTQNNLSFLLFFAISILITVSCKKSNNQSTSIQTEKKATVTTIAGDGREAFVNGPALSASFHTPLDVAVSADGTIYVADFNSHRIRKIAGGQVTTLAGNDAFDILNGDGENASFKNPYRVQVDANGNVYVLDQEDSRVRKITAAGHVTTYAGSSEDGFLDGASADAEFALNEEGILAGADGNIYIGDTFNNRIRRIGNDAQVSTFAGDGTEGLLDGSKEIARFRWPGGMAFDKDGNMYVADNGNFCIRKITRGGEVIKFSGTGVDGGADGDATTAEFHFISDIVSDREGNLYLADENKIRKVTPQGNVSTIAGSVKGFEDGDGAVAKFSYPAGLAIDQEGNLYVADGINNKIRKISFK